MSLRYSLLAAGAAGVVVLGVYLFFEVRAAPAPAAPVTTTAARSAPAPQPARPLLHPSEPTPAASAGSNHHYTDAELDAMIGHATQAYDHEEYDDAMDLAKQVLGARPSNIHMLRIMVSASCINGDSVTAQKYYDLLPRQHKVAMSTRCARYGVTFEDHTR